MTYTMNYGVDGAVDQTAVRKVEEISAKPPRARISFGIPSIAKTFITLLSGAALLVGVEAWAPEWASPSAHLGNFEARVDERVKAAELAQQAKYEAWAAQVKLGVDQSNEQYKALNQAFLANYQATYERAKIFAEATGRIQAAYVDYRMQQTRMEQGTDISIINLARGWGRIAEVFSPGAGQAALEYADNLSGELSGELTSAAANAQVIKVDGWNTNLASLDDLRRNMESIKPFVVPPPPHLAFETSRTLVAARQ